MRVQRIEKLMQMLTENKDDIFALYALGMEFEGMNQPDEAIKYFNKVLQLEPTKVSVYYRLGIILQQKGKDDEALSILKTGLILLKDSKDQKTKNEFQSLIEEIEF